MKVLSAVPLRQVMEDLGPRFEHATGWKLAITFATLGDVVKRIQDGDLRIASSFPSREPITS